MAVRSKLAAAFSMLVLIAYASSIEQDVTCDREPGGSCTSKAQAQASLLQKVFKHDAKVTHTQEQPGSSDGTACTGINTQGRCWYLSDLGQSCAETCVLHGRSFSYTISSAEEPVTPLLVEHEPKLKQEPWAALECYVPSEDRYHTANENAARHYVEDVGSWSHENCKLACPCGGPGSDRCSWKQPAECVSVFMYKAVEYSGCATVDPDHERPWCQHHYQHIEKVDTPDWSYCEYECEEEKEKKVVDPLPPPEKKGCQWVPTASCVKEYDYQGHHYTGCSGVDHDTPWCSNTNPYKGSWNNCVYVCPDDVSPPVAPPPKRKVEETCSWKPMPGCSETTEYKGVEYNGCIERDHPTPWCSHDKIHRDSFEVCKRVCETVAPVPVPPLPSPDRSDPCDRHPEAENDEIGNSVSLDEAGYQTTAKAESPINMKRFVCRVVNELGCKVVDQTALISFVPYYSGLVAQQTYARLVSELTTLCHLGDKWVVPVKGAPTWE